MPPCSTGLGNHISRYTIPNFATLPKNMPITLDTFKAVANATAFSSRDIVVSGAGIRQIMANLEGVLNNMPTDENKRAEVTEILDDMMTGLERVSGNLPGDASQRMGNEIMIG